MRECGNAGLLPWSGCGWQLCCSVLVISCKHQSWIRDFPERENALLFLVVRGEDVFATCIIFWKERLRSVNLSCFPFVFFLLHIPSPPSTMPVFTEYSTSSRDLRVLPSFAPPVPRLTPKFEPKGTEEKYEVVISGVTIPFPTVPSR